LECSATEFFHFAEEIAAATVTTAGRAAATVVVAAASDFDPRLPMARKNGHCAI